MKRLLKDAEALKAAQGETTEYSLDSFSDIIEAIHVVQDNLGITGTTAKEAGSTIQGSINMAKAAWQNFLTGLADPDADMKLLTTNLTTSIGTAFSNAIPAVKRMLAGAFEGTLELLEQAGFNGAADLLRGIKNGLSSEKVQRAFDAISKRVESMSTWWGNFFEEVRPTVEKIADFVAGAVEGVIELFGGLFEIAEGESVIANVIVGISGAVDKLSEAFAYVWPSVTEFVDSVGTEIGFILGIVGDVLGKVLDTIGIVGKALVEKFKPVFEAINDAFNSEAVGVIDTITTTFGNLINDVLDWIIENADVVANALMIIGGAFAALKIAGAVSAIAAALNPITLVIGAIAAVAGALYYFFTETEEGQQIWADFMASMEELTRRVGPYVMDAIDGIQKAFDDLVKFFTEDPLGIAIVDTMGYIASSFGELLVDIIAFVMSIPQKMMDTYDGLIDYFAHDPLGQTIYKVFKGITDFLGGTLQFIVGLFQSACGLVYGIATGDFTALGDGLNNIMNGIAHMFSGAWDTIAAIFEHGVRAAADFISHIPEHISNLLNFVSNAARSIGENIARFFYELPGRIINAISGIPNAIAQVFSRIHIPQLHVEGGFNLDPEHFKVPQIKFYAEGGFVGKPTAINVAGEKGTEVVLSEQGRFTNRFAAAIAANLDARKQAHGDTYFVIDGAVVNSDEEMERQFYKSMMLLKRKADMYA